MWLTIQYVAWTWKSTGTEARKAPLIPPIRHIDRNPRGKSHRRGKEGRPPPQGGDPVEHLDSGRDRDQEGHEREERQVDLAGGEHVVGPHGEAPGADRGGGEDERPVAEERLAREGRQGLPDPPP